MDKGIKITASDILKANQRMAEKRPIDISELSEISQRIFKNFTVTDEDIAKAFKQARQEIANI